MSSIRVSIVGDDPFFCAGLTQALAAHAALLIGSSELQAWTTEALVAADVLLLDSRINGIVRRCAALEPSQRPYPLLIMVPDEVSAVEALAAGARGVVQKSEPMTHLVHAIRAVHAGSVWAPRHLIAEVWRRHRRGTPGIEQRLSRREYEVVRSVVSGMSNKELAARLQISTATVKAHLTHVFAKLGVQGRGELVALYHGVPFDRMRHAPRPIAGPR